MLISNLYPFRLAVAGCIRLVFILKLLAKKKELMSQETQEHPSNSTFLDPEAKKTEAPTLCRAFRFQHWNNLKTEWAGKGR